ncbi:hypothetical protein [Flintibacter hominis]|nr:hypothetical protein [Flintibacter hominis]
MVPEREYSYVSRKLWQGNQQALQELEAAKRFAVFHIRESG